MEKRQAFDFVAIFSCILIIVGCSTTYYAVWEQLGKEKRHLFELEVATLIADMNKSIHEADEFLRDFQ
jgi:hypothetical protein